MANLPEADLQFTVSVKKDKSIQMLPEKMKSVMEQIEGMVGLEGKQRSNASFKRSKKSSGSATKAVEKTMREALKKIDTSSETALMTIMEDIRNEAVELTPEDTGKLRRSAFAATSILKTVIQGRVGYNITSGPVPPGVETGVDYAVLVHENRVGVQFKVGQAGFLLEAMNRHAGDIKIALEVAIDME
jgi:hypothetical protein